MLDYYFLNCKDVTRSEQPGVLIIVTIFCFPYCFITSQTDRNKIHFLQKTRKWDVFFLHFDIFKINKILFFFSKDIRRNQSVKTGKCILNPNEKDFAEMAFRSFNFILSKDSIKIVAHVKSIHHLLYNYLTGIC